MKPTRPNVPVIDNSSDPNGEFPLAPVEYYFYLLGVASRRRDLALGAALAPTGLSTDQWRALAVIRRSQGCSMKALALYTAIDRTTLTRTVDQLVRRGYVARWTPPEDRRQVNVALTDEGEAAYLESVQLAIRSNASILDGVDSDRLREATLLFQDVLRRLTPNEALADDLVNFLRPPMR